jgi:predicted permease
MYNPVATVFSSAPLTCMATLLATGALVRYLKPATALRILPPIRNATFNYFLPALVLRSMWRVHIEHSMMLVALCSLLCHTAVMCLFQLCLTGVDHRPTKGFLILALQGCMLSFLYSGIGEHPKFGREATAVCLMWDMGGNFWVSQALCFAVGSVYAPRKKDAAILPSLVTSAPRAKSPSQVTEVAKEILFTPLLQAFALGVVLNLLEWSSPLYVTNTLDVVGSFFRPCLYSVLGLLLSFDLLGDEAAVRLVFRALALRYVSMGALALFAWKFLGFDDVTRSHISHSII